MRFYVCVKSLVWGTDNVYLYDGCSNTKAKDTLQTTVNMMRAVKGTGIIAFQNEDSAGRIHFVNGVTVTE